MSLDTIPVPKTLSERETEYLNIFSREDKIVTSCDVKNIWSDYIELSSASTPGWQAFWRIPREICNILNIGYPTVVFVEVNGVDSENLSALVTVVAVQDNVELPEQLEVKLINLYPSIQQRHTSLEIKCIAETLDKLRFFYNNIWQLWDEDDPCLNEDWVTNCLKPRMKLFCDLQSGIIRPHIVSHFKEILQKAKGLYKHKAFLKDEYKKVISESSKEECYNTKERDLSIELMELDMECKKIRRYIGMMENPILRDKVYEKHWKSLSSFQELDGEQYFIIWNKGSFKMFMKLMNDIQVVLPDSTLILPCDFSIAMNQMKGNSTALLCPGIHVIRKDMNLMKNGTLKGFPPSCEVILTSPDSSSTLMECGGSRFELSNLILSAKVSQPFIVVRKGLLKARHCHFTCDSRNEHGFGLRILADGVVEMADCVLNGFDVGIVVEPGARLSLENCRIMSCSTGIQIGEGAQIVLKDSLVESCFEYGLVFEIDANIQETVGTLELLESCDSVTVENTRMKGNVLGDVLISSVSDLSLDKVNTDSDE